MKQTFRIVGQLPGANDYTKACRTHYHVGARMKHDTEEMIAGFIRIAGLRPVEGPVGIRYRWVEPNARRDLDNIAFARKFIQDALVRVGILAGDGRKHIKGFRDDFVTDKHAPGVVVTIVPGDEWEDVSDV